MQMAPFVEELDACSMEFEARMILRVIRTIGSVGAGIFMVIDPIIIKLLGHSSINFFG